MARLLSLWAILALSLAVATISTSVMVFRDVDLTQTMFFSLLMIPTAEAIVLAGFMRPQAGTILSPTTLRRALAHPLARPVLWIDAAVMPAGWLFLHHPLVGMAAAGIVQRRWMGTKLIVAAICLGIAALRRDTRLSTVERSALLATGVVLAAIGVNGFHPVLQAAARRLPAPLLRQPWPFVIFEVYAVAAVALIGLVLTAGRLLEAVSSPAAELYDSAAGALFVLALFATMNGFLSLQPIHPWAGLAVTSGSLAGTILAIAGILLAARNGSS